MPEHVIIYGSDTDDCINCDLIKDSLEQHGMTVTERKLKDYITIPEIKNQTEKQHGTLPVVWFPSRKEFVAPREILSGAYK